MHLNKQAVRDLRTSKNWTQQQLAVAASLSLRTIQRVEASGIASLETCAAYCAVFNVKQDSLLLQSPVEMPNNSDSMQPFFTGLNVGFGVGLGIGVCVGILVIYFV